MMRKEFKINFILLVLILASLKVAGQEPYNPILNFPTVQLHLREILTLVENQTEINFSYSPDKIPLDSMIELSSPELSLNEILLLLENSGLELSRRSDYYIIKPARKTMPISPPQKFFTVSGFVTDKNNKESLIGASISIRETGKGTISNGYGFFSLRLKEGAHSLLFSFVGYKPAIREINLKANQNLRIDLERRTEELEEVKIVLADPVESFQNQQMGRTTLAPNSIRKTPGFMGESDVIKSLQSIPGIHFYSDGSTIFHVRGGARDQNLLLIDEAPVYNPAHMLGIFSVFSPDALNSVDIYKGDMPSWYGGRLSSVIDIKTREGNREEFSFSGNTNLVASTLNFEAPLFQKKGSFYLSARRSHLKWLVSRDNQTLEQLHFSDLNLKTNYRINNKNRLFFSFYSGLDQFRNREAYLRSTGISWRNFAGNLRWNHIYGERLFSNTSLIISDYDYNLYTSYQLDQRWNAGISLTALKSDHSFFINPSSTLYYGIYLGYHSYYPGHFLDGDNPDPLRPGVANKYTSENIIYISHKLELTNSIEVRYGLRAGSWINRGETTEYTYNENNRVTDTLNYARGEVYNRFPVFEPRLSIGFRPGKRLNAKLAYSRNSQFEFLISNSISPFTSLEVWLPAGPNIEPMISDQVTAGLNFNPPGSPISFNAEVFYKKTLNYISYVDHAFMLFNPQVETELRFGRAKAYGAEFILKKYEGRWNGWISYALSKVNLEIPGINNNNPFPPRYNRPHSLSLFSEYTISRRWDFSASWIYASGSPFTTPSGYYYYMGYQVPYYEERNNDRLPDYHRLDLSTSIQLNGPDAKSEHILQFSIFNVYGRKNPFNITFNKIVDENGNIVVPSDYREVPELEKTMMYLFGTIPSISYQFKF
jgi:hypothetical protein